MSSASSTRMTNGSKREGGGAEPTITLASAATAFCHVEQSGASLNVRGLEKAITRRSRDSSTSLGMTRTASSAHAARSRK
jgi:hypothetical protein